MTAPTTARLPPSPQSSGANPLLEYLLPSPEFHSPAAISEIAERIEAARAGLDALRQPDTLQSTPEHIGAVRQAHLDTVSHAAALTAARSPGDPPHPAGPALRDAAMRLGEADQHLVGLARSLWRNNITGVTYTDNPSAHSRLLRKAERALDRAAEGLRLEAERASGPAASTRSGLRAAAARVRSAFVSRPAPDNAAVAQAARSDAPAPTAPARGPR